jgi:hypothetical protein
VKPRFDLALPLNPPYPVAERLNVPDKCWVIGRDVDHAERLGPERLGPERLDIDEWNELPEEREKLPAL